MTTSSHPRLNNEVYLCSVRDADLERLLERLVETDVQCVIDLHAPRLARSRDEISAIELGAESRGMHYAHLPAPSVTEPEVSGQPSRALAWAARTALRYRTCLITRGLAKEEEGAREIAALVGLRLVGLEDASRPEKTE